jgi:predicted O-methyltransferase YrrM
MTLTPEQVFTIAHKITGWLEPHETMRLYGLALDIPENGAIVEIGSYRGKSTTVLAIGAKERSARVYAIDPFEGVMDGHVVTGHDRDHLRYALVNAGVVDSVEIITGYSLETAKTWKRPIDLLWIDGDHSYEAVKADLKAWSKHVKGKIALHDYTQNWPGVPMAVDEFVADGKWRIVDNVDATVVLERVK